MAIKNSRDRVGALFLCEGLDVVGVLVRGALAEDRAVAYFELVVVMGLQLPQSALFVIHDPLHLVDAVLELERNRKRLLRYLPLPHNIVRILDCLVCTLEQSVAFRQIGVQLWLDLFYLFRRVDDELGVYL